MRTEITLTDNSPKRNCRFKTNKKHDNYLVYIVTYPDVFFDKMFIVNQSVIQLKDPTFKSKLT